MLTDPLRLTFEVVAVISGADADFALVYYEMLDHETFKIVEQLKDIKQLGVCYHVFPGASHNRFEHSIGVYHLSKQYMNILNRNWEFTEREITCISIAGLVHDIGHGPFSHLFDEIIT